MLNKYFKRRSLLILFALIVIMILSFGPILRKIGSLIIVDDAPTDSDAIVVLNTGIEYYPRLIQAADIYRQGIVRKVVVNGNRKTDTLRELEAKGFQRCCPWYENTARILTLLEVRQEDIIIISAEDAYDTMTEAQAVGSELLRRKFKKVIVTTSKSHTRRARFIWRKMFEGELEVSMVSAKSDPYNPDNWWKDGRQIRWVLAEYGAWIYYGWKSLTGI